MSSDLDLVFIADMMYPETRDLRRVKKTSQVEFDPNLSELDVDLCKLKLERCSCDLARKFIEGMIETKSREASVLMRHLGVDVFVSVDSQVEKLIQNEFKVKQEIFAKSRSISDSIENSRLMTPACRYSIQSDIEFFASILGPTKPQPTDEDIEKFKKMLPEFDNHVSRNLLKAVIHAKSRYLEDLQPHMEQSEWVACFEELVLYFKAKKKKEPLKGPARKLWS